MDETSHSLGLLTCMSSGERKGNPCPSRQLRINGRLLTLAQALLIFVQLTQCPPLAWSHSDLLFKEVALEAMMRGRGYTETHLWP